MPDSLTEIGDATFAGYYKLKKVRFGKGLQTIAYLAFASCISLEEIDIPDSVVEIGAAAFDGCNKLKDILLPERLKEWNCLRFLPIYSPCDVFFVPWHIAWDFRIVYNYFQRRASSQNIIIPFF